MLTPDASSSAVYFGNQTSGVHGGIVYNSTTPFGLAFRTNGNSTKVVITDIGNVGIGTIAPTEKLQVNGNICYTGSIAACSDIRYKKDILPISNTLQSLQSIHGIYYNWDKEKFKDMAFDDHRQIGFSAQELETVFPEMVHTDINGYKSVDYSRMTPVLVEAIKEQQKIILEENSEILEQQRINAQQQQSITEQQKQITFLLKEVSELKKFITEIGGPR
ncbi:MAG: tail fiber domain-containing protein [Saprospiraceae bacterium]